MPVFHEGEEVRQRGSEGFTYKEKIADIGLVDLIWNVYKRGAWELWPPGVSTLGGSTWLYLYQWPETHLAQPGALPLPHTTCREKQRKEWIHTPSDVGPNPFISTKEVQSNPYNPSGRGDGPIHFTQDVHHIQPRQPTRDAPIGSRTPSLLPTTGKTNQKRSGKS